MLVAQKWCSKIVEPLLKCQKGLDSQYARMVKLLAANGFGGGDGSVISVAFCRPKGFLCCGHLSGKLSGQSVGHLGGFSPVSHW